MRGDGERLPFTPRCKAKLAVDCRYGKRTVAEEDAKRWRLGVDDLQYSVTSRSRVSQTCLSPRSEPSTRLPHAVVGGQRCRVLRRGASPVRCVAPWLDNGYLYPRSRPPQVRVIG